MNYTKGEWKVKGNYIVLAGSGAKVAQVTVDWPDYEIAYHANLIAAAPAMYEALKAIIEECPDPQLPYGKAVVRIATEALAKAEGK